MIRGSSFFSVTLYEWVFADNERAGALCKDCKGPLLRWYPLDEVFVFHCCFTHGSGAPAECYSTWILNLAWPALACWDTWKSVAEDKMPEASFATHSLKHELTHMSSLCFLIIVNRPLNVGVEPVWVGLTKWLSYIPQCLFVCVCVCGVGVWMESREAVCQCVRSSLLPLCCLGCIVWQRETERGLEVVLHLKAWILKHTTTAIYPRGDWSANERSGRERSS